MKPYLLFFSLFFYVTNLFSQYTYIQTNITDNKIILIDIGHYESEKYTKDLIFKHLNEKIPKFAVAIAETNTNPVNYN